MEVRRLEASDRPALFAFINSESRRDRSFVDQFFHDVLSNKQAIIVIEDEIIFALVLFDERILNVCGYKIKTAHVIDRIIKKDSDKQALLERCFEVLKSDYFIIVNQLDEIFDENNVIVNRQAYTIYRRQLFNAEGYVVSDDFDTDSFLSLYQYFMSKFDIAFDYKEYLKLDFLRKEHEIYASQDENGVNGFIAYNYRKGIMHVEALMYKDAKALLSLLNQAMGMNDKIIVEVSSFENMNKVLKKTTFEASEKVEIIISDLDVFRRLFNYRSPDMMDLISKHKLRYYFV